MALNVNSGWTAASLLPTLAHGFSPGFSVGSMIAPAQSSSNPISLKGTTTESASRMALLNKIMGTGGATGTAGTAGAPAVGSPAQVAPKTPTPPPNPNVIPNSVNTTPATPAVPKPTANPLAI